MTWVDCCAEGSCCELLGSIVCVVGDGQLLIADARVAVAPSSSTTRLSSRGIKPIHTSTTFTSHFAVRPAGKLHKSTADISYQRRSVVSTNITPFGPCVAISLFVGLHTHTTSHIANLAPLSASPPACTSLLRLTPLPSTDLYCQALSARSTQ